METRTLLVINILFFSLYALMSLLGQRAFRGLLSGARGSRWFAAGNVSMGTASSLLLFASLPALRGCSEPLSWVALAAGRTMLHRSFAELASHGRSLWRSQLTILSAVLAAAAGSMAMPAAMPAARFVVCLLWAMQCCLTAVLLLRASAPGIRLASSFTAGVLVLYAGTHSAWFWSVVAMHLHPDLLLLKGLLLIGLVSNGAIAFGFELLLVSRFRIVLEREASRDELTGLLNRRALRKAAAQAIVAARRHRRPLAVVLVDLDDFKAVNDRLGHAAGDAVLCAVAEVLQGAVRDGDKVGRVGGDEFCLLLPQTAPVEALRVAARCRVGLTRLVVSYEGNAVRVGGSIGVGHSADGRLSWKELLEHGDQALYDAKRAGKNRVALANVRKTRPSPQLPGSRIVIGQPRTPKPTS